MARPVVIINTCQVVTVPISCLLNKSYKTDGKGNRVLFWSKKVIHIRDFRANTDLEKLLFSSHPNRILRHFSF